MKKTSITEAKNNLSALIDGLRNGAPVLIADRGRPVARLEPAAMSDEGAEEGRLNRLVREGLVRPGRASPLSALLAAEPPPIDRNASALALLVHERREGR